LKIIECLSHRLVEKVPASEIDADILALPYSVEGLISFNFWQEGFYWVCHKDVCPKKVLGNKTFIGAVIRMSVQKKYRKLPVKR
jgi:hypothetical protein